MLANFIHFWEIIIVIYFLTYNTINFFLIIVAWKKVSYYLKTRHYSDLENINESFTAPSVALIIPAYNEEETITESIKSLTKLIYPKIEIIIVNDGSSDGTLQRLISDFSFILRDFGYTQKIATAKIRGLYSTALNADNVKLTLVDKENGGKADALNAGINAAESEYVCCMDADSIMDPRALLQAMQPFLLEDQKVVACGGQVAIANGSEIENGTVKKVKLPKNPLAMFQVVEYMRSFTAGRTALSSLNSLLILSGVFAIFDRMTVLKVGGFLSGRSESKISQEYCGDKQTVCEDMEIIVRIYRYLIEKNLPGKVVFLPYPIVWSQGPETISDFGKQRNRWYRGLAQVLFHHIKMLFNPKYKQVGLFAMPYQFLFEFLGPLFELAGYVSIPFFYAMGLLNWSSFFFFMAASILYGTFLSIFSVFLGIWTEGKLHRQLKTAKLFQYEGFWSITKLIVYAALSMVGYRQIQLYYQMKGFIGFLTGSQSWDKFSRAKF
jgi:cellulose synthase/poly-beta-1,6-N-acetylglucosamine synthase-like glycosyltransferase